MTEDNKENNRTPRSAETRAIKDTARKPWRPPSMLETPPAPEAAASYIQQACFGPSGMSGIDGGTALVVMIILWKPQRQGPYPQNLSC